MRTIRRTPRTRAETHRRTRAVRWAAAAVAGTLALAGCGLRLETPPPTAPTPDAAEVVRSRSVTDALQLARSAKALAPISNGPVADVLGRVADFSDRHAAELGGVYDSGLATPSPDGPTPRDPKPSTAATPPTGPATPSTSTGVATPAQVLALLAATERTAAADAAAVSDGGLARLLGSIATSRSRLTVQLAGALGVAVPPAGATPTAGAVDVAPGQPTPDVAATRSASSSGPEASPGAGVRASARVGVVAAEDEAGYGFEVVAAKLTEPSRSAARTSAAAHRARAEVWAKLWGIDGTAADPRRASYALPPGLDDNATALALARTLAGSVTTTYASAIADAAPGSRAELLGALLTADSEAAPWGVPATAFPGLPERTG